MSEEVLHALSTRDEGLTGTLNHWFNQEMFRRTMAVAAAAHELKTPLAVMSGYTDLLLGERLGPLTEGQKSILAEMQRNADRLQKLIQSFLNFGALESGKFKLGKELGDINECIAQVVEDWAVVFAKRGVACEFFPDRAVEPFFYDFLKIQHVISNLLDNASKFSPRGGRVRVLSEAHLWERRTRGQNLPFVGERRSSSGYLPNAVRIKVIDEGPGIPPEHHQEIFTGFLQLQHFSQSPGIGLGLAIARRLIEAHEGKIWVESEPGQGSTFCLLLPIKRRQE